MGRNRRVVTRSARETMNCGAALGASSAPNTVICLYGDLGAGKTTFVKGLVQGVTGVAPEKVVSPTFVYLNIYDNVYHFDLYRLHDVEEFVYLGFEEYFFAGGICCIEWSERIAPIIPEGALLVTLSHLTEESREIFISESPIPENGR